MRILLLRKVRLARLFSVGQLQTSEARFVLAVKAHDNFLEGRGRKKIRKSKCRTVAITKHHPNEHTELP